MSVERFRQAQEAVLERWGVRLTSRYVEVPAVGGRAHVLTGGEGPPAVMLCGGGMPAAMWAPLIAHLDGYTIHAIDLPGFGLTDTTPGFMSGMRSNSVRFLAEVLDGLALASAPVVGNSLGALWAIWLAIDRPERVAAMVHIGCPALLPGTSAPPPIRLLAVPGLGRALNKLQPPSLSGVQRLAKMIGEHPLPGAVADLLLATQRLPGFEDTFLATLRALLRLRGARPQTALTTEQLAAIGQPVQFLWGRDDPYGTPELAERAAESISEAELLVVPGGHTPWVRHGEQVAPPVSRFLRLHAPTG